MYPFPSLFATLSSLRCEELVQALLLEEEQQEQEQEQQHQQQQRTQEAVPGDSIFADTGEPATKRIKAQED